ncbi:MAG: BNR repeat-containing protein [Chitinophagaceae bacterium]
MNSTVIHAQKIISVDSAWANNSVNTVVFRKNSLVTYKQHQFISYYNNDGFVVVGKRNLNSTKWILKQTPFKGKVTDAHNCISIMVDGEGYVHLSWDHHKNKLHYAKSTQPLSLDFEFSKMTGLHEEDVTYPEFQKLPSGNLMFLYRDGGSGNGNLVINFYSLQSKSWKQLHTNLIDGEGKRNAYWQTCIDAKGNIHLSWVWRESPDVSSNHDMSYAVSDDEGNTWKKSNGITYSLPINITTAEVVCNIPQGSELINQTSMFASNKKQVFIATYYKEQNDSIPQYHIIYNIGKGWNTANTSFRKTAFSLSGVGTKKIPISRPQIIAVNQKNQQKVGFVFRDIERGNAVTIAWCNNLQLNKWSVTDVYKKDVGSWEPSYDTELWKQKKQLHLFVLKTTQIDGEGKANVAAEMVHVLEYQF